MRNYRRFYIGDAEIFMMVMNPLRQFNLCFNIEFDKSVYPMFTFEIGLFVIFFRFTR